MIEKSLNRTINKVFYQIALGIYDSDMEREMGMGWKPLRPVFLDYAITPYIFQELIRLIKLSVSKNLEKDLANIFATKQRIMTFQYLWPTLSFTQNDFSFEDKLFLIKKLIEYSESLPEGEFDSLYEILEKDIPDADKKEALRKGTDLYMQRLQPVYELLDEDYGAKLLEATSVVCSRADLIRDPGPWDDKTRGEAIRKLVRNSDFRREKEKGLEEVVRGVPGVPGITTGVVGENILVEFGITTLNTDIDGYIIDTDAFKTLSREEFSRGGIVVVSGTRNGTKKLKSGDKVWVDGTSGVVYRT